MHTSAKASGKSRAREIEDLKSLMSKVLRLGLRSEGRPRGTIHVGIPGTRIPKSGTGIAGGTIAHVP
jgi:hypothetical protein